MTPMKLTMLGCVLSRHSTDASFRPMWTPGRAERATDCPFQLPQSTGAWLQHRAHNTGVADRRNGPWGEAEVGDDRAVGAHGSEGGR